MKQKTKTKAKVKTKVAASKAVYTNVSIVNNTYCDGYDTRGEEGPYSGHCEEDYSNDIQGFKIVDNKSYNDLAVPYKIDSDKDKTHYLLYVVHTSGDSFKSVSGLVSYVDMYQSKKLAEENARKIREHNNRYNEESMTSEETWNLEITNDIGKKYKISTSEWTGYFERIQSIEVQEVKLIKEY